MEDNEDDSVDVGNLDLYEGDVSVVFRADGDVEFLIAIDDETSEQYIRSINLVQYIKFALEDRSCKELFEKSLLKIVN